MTAGKRTTLLDLLRRGHVRMALVAMLTFGTMLVGIAHGLLSRTQAQHLKLVARTVGYTVEAALTFRDEETAREILKNIAEREQLASVEVLLPSGQVFASHTLPSQGQLDTLAQQVGEWLIPNTASAPVQLEGHAIGEIHLRGDGALYGWLVLNGLTGALLCVAVTFLAGLVMARRIERSITEPVERLAALTRSIRSEGAYERRAPDVTIAELQALSDDFNAMLEQVQRSEAELKARQRRLQRDNDALAHKAWHDELTGLANRSQFEHRLQDALNITRQRGGHLGVLFLDADGFKEVNDTAGHAAGDRLLVLMAERLRVAVRETDVVARLGGDEFAVLLHPLRSVEDARRVSLKIHHQMSEPFDLDEHGEFTCGLSAGLATYPLDGDTIPALLDVADRDMYRTKHINKRNRARNSAAMPLQNEPHPEHSGEREPPAHG